MSEFSESYHLKSQRSEDAVELLRLAGIKGYVFPPTNGWVTFLADDGVFEPDERIVAANKGQLLHYVYAEDHGWSFSIFEITKCVCAYKCDWNDDVEVDETAYSPAVLGSLIIERGVTTLAEVEARFHPSSFDEVFELEAARFLAESVGLVHYDLLDYEHMARDFDESPEDHPDLIEVS